MAIGGGVFSGLENFRDMSNPDFHYGIDATKNQKPFGSLVVHHTADKPIDNLVRYGQSVDNERGGAFGYHFYIGRDGSVIQGAPLNKRTNHVKPPSHKARSGKRPNVSNSNALGISLVGAENGATPEQLDAARKLSQNLMSEYGIDSNSIFGHGELQSDRMNTEGLELVNLLREDRNMVERAGTEDVKEDTMPQFDPARIAQALGLDAPSPPALGPQAADAGGGMPLGEWQSPEQYQQNFDPTRVPGGQQGGPQQAPPPAMAAAMDQSNAEPGFLKKIQEWWQPVDDMISEEKADQLLALGSGMLATDGNFFQMLGGGGQSMLQTKMAQQQEDRFGSSRRYRSIGNAEMKDGTVKGNLVVDRQTGRILEPSVDGGYVDVSDQVGTLINKSHASGSRQMLTGSQLTKLEEDLREKKTTLDLFDRTLSKIDDINTGWRGMADDLRTNLKTFLQRENLTEEEFKRAVAKGEIQGLVGRAREDVVGPGVMTEQDALRIISALGGDLSILTNPQVLKEQLTKFRDLAQRSYETSQYSYRRQKQFYPGMLNPEFLGEPETTTRSESKGQSEIDSLMQQYQ